MKKFTVVAILSIGCVLVNGQVKKTEAYKDDLLTFSALPKNFIKQRNNLAINIWGSLGMGRFFTEQSRGSLGYWSMDFSMTKLVETTKGPVYRNHSVKLRVISSLTYNYYGYRGEFGLLYGKTFGYRVKGNISAGIGVLKGMERVKASPSGSGYTPPYKASPYSCVNLPLEVGLNYVPSRFFGLGIGGIASINSKQSLVGFYLKLGWGKIR